VNIARFVYHRLGVPVWAEEEKVLAELALYYDEHVQGGQAALTEAFKGAVLEEHRRAADTYRFVTEGQR
jgi:hypothetical protein